MGVMVKVFLSNRVSIILVKALYFAVFNFANFARRPNLRK